MDFKIFSCNPILCGNLKKWLKYIYIAYFVVREDIHFLSIYSLICLSGEGMFSDLSQEMYKLGILLQ